jgi:hypothetical protein
MTSLPSFLDLAQLADFARAYPEEFARIRADAMAHPEKVAADFLENPPDEAELARAADFVREVPALTGVPDEVFDRIGEMILASPRASLRFVRRSSVLRVTRCARASRARRGAAQRPVSPAPAEPPEPPEPPHPGARAPVSRALAPGQTDAANNAPTGRAAAVYAPRRRKSS